MPHPLIVTAEFSAPDFAWLEGLRRAHYPADRNQVPAHLTLLHALPPSLAEEAKTQLAAQARGRPPRAEIAGLMDLGGGVAFRVVSDDLESIREQLADHFHGMLGAQDSGGWRPHVTVQNKVAPKAARTLKAKLETGFVARPLGIAALALHHYLGGPWETIGRYPFRGR
jgi:hypothetical protein